MKADIMFIDQTLGYVLENQGIDNAEFIYIKQKIAAMSQTIFDLTLPSLMTVFGDGAVVEKDIRAGIQSDAQQVEQAHQLGCNKVKVSLTDTIVNELPSSLLPALRQARARAIAVSLQITDSRQYSLNKTVHLLRHVKEYGISSIIFEDKQSEHDPVSTYRALLNLQQQVSCPVEYCGKNGRGLASGNALAAIKSGVSHIAVAVGGVAGYPAYEEVLMGTRCLLKLPLPVPGDLAACCQEILSYAGQRVAPTKPIIGSKIFDHESGIHVDGVNKKSDLYEPFAPETVGLSRRVIIGKHSGKAAIELKLREMNISLQPALVPIVLDKVRSLAIQQKTSVSDLQLQKLVCEVAS